MGLMDKVKNLFTEEVIEETEEIKEEPIKKEMIQVEIPSPVEEEIEEKPVIKEEPKKEEKEDFKFPFFDDEDFTTIESKPKEDVKTRFSREPIETKDIYNPKEEKKGFKPTPIISPVYGILDKNYQKEDIKTKPRSYYDPKEATVDEIRNKAYGTLEDELETTLFGKNRLIFDDKPKEVTETLEEIKDDQKLKHATEDNNNLIAEPKPKKEKSINLLQDDLVETKNEPKKISDRELFDMIDSMYQKGGNE